MLWPEAWKLTLTFKELSPSNFNMYANYYQNGFIPDDLQAVRRTALSSFGAAVDNVLSFVEDIFAEIKEAINFKESVDARRQSIGFHHRFAPVWARF